MCKQSFWLQRMSAQTSRDQVMDDQQIRKAFQRFDINGDGVIAREELCYVLKQLTTGGGFGDEEIKVLLSVADADEDGNISYEEFVNWVMDDAEAVEVFEQVDMHQLKPLQDIKWREAIVVPAQYLKRGTKVAKTERRAMTLRQVSVFS